MTRPAIGVVAGAALGLIDGMSAWFYPEARAMMVPIILGSTVKGLLTGLSVGLVAKWKQSLPLGILVGALVGFVLSSLVAIGQPAQYWEIVLPGMLVGVIAGIICQRWRAGAVALCCLLGASGLAGASQATPTSRLSAVQPLVGRWQGTSEGQPGTGTLTREYRAVLRDRFIEETNRSVYAPQEKNLKGEIHEHRSFFSFDNARKTVVFRHFTAKASSINTSSSRQRNQACSCSSAKLLRTFLRGTAPERLTPSSVKTNSKRCSKLLSPARISPSTRRLG